jgi:hypothetical protein
MSTVQNLIESANPWQSQQGDASRLAGKWAKSGLLEGLKDYDKSNMAVMLENQAKQLVVEQSQTGTGGTFTPGTGEQWAGVALPLVRKVFGQIASKEFVSVQPMSLPAGLVFFLDFQYGTTKNPFTSGTSMYGNSLNAPEGFGNTNTGGLYGAGRFGYSLNQFSASLAFQTSSAGGTTYLTGSSTTGLTADAIWALTGFDSDISASVARNEVKLAYLVTSSLTNFDPNTVRSTYFISASAITTADNLNKYNYVTGGTAVLFISASTAEITAQVSPTASVFYNKKTADNARGDFEDGTTTGTTNAVGASGTQIAIPEINVQLRSETIAAKTRKLKAQWTPEFAQDLNAYQNLDAEAELTSMLSEYISLEIDLEILDMLIENVPTDLTEYWSAKVGNQLNSAGTNFDSNTSGVYYTQMTWFQTLGIKLQKVSNGIHQRTLRGGANFMVCSPTVATILESIPGFAADTDGAADNMKYAFGVQKIGQLNSRYKVYKNPYMTENTILMGFRGNQFLETGAVYAPYVPLIMTPLVYDPATFTPRKGIMTRYAKKMVRPEFYGKVFVANLNVI